MAAITLYTKTYCPYSKQVKALLSRKGLEYEDIDVTEDEVRLAEMVERSGGSATVPQVFIHGRHVGGCEELMSLEEEGGLDELMSEGGASEAPSAEGAHAARRRASQP
jgi:glutaredoxin 3